MHRHTCHATHTALKTRHCQQEARHHGPLPVQWRLCAASRTDRPRGPNAEQGGTAAPGRPRMGGASGATELSPVRLHTRSRSCTVQGRTPRPVALAAATQKGQGKAHIFTWSSHNHRHGQARGPLSTRTPRSRLLSADAQAQPPPTRGAATPEACCGRGDRQARGSRSDTQHQGHVTTRHTAPARRRDTWQTHQPVPSLSQGGVALPATPETAGVGPRSCHLGLGP